MANYVPLLRMKRGELTALKELQAATKAKVTPYLDVSSDRFRGKKATKAQPALSAPENIASSIQKSWGTNRIYVDAAKVSPSPASPHPIAELADEAHALGVALVPATQLSASAVYWTDVTSVHAKHGTGACLKIDLQEMSSAATWAPSLPLPLSAIDLLIDLDTNVANAAALGKALTDAFKALHNASDWRSVTVAGSSMPENFSGYTKGQHLLSRIEHDLWKRLSAALPYDLGYGDYATVAVTAPPSGIAWGFPINARYTLDDEFLVCRGVKTTGPGAKDLDVQLVGHARDIVAHPKRVAIANCWADKKIDAVAASGSGQGNLETWVKIGVNRHIELMKTLVT